MPQSILVVSQLSELVGELQEALTRAGDASTKLDHAPSPALAARILSTRPADIQGVVVDLNERAAAISLIESIQQAGDALPIYAAALNGVPRSDAQVAIRAGARKAFSRIDDFPKLLAEQRLLSRVTPRKPNLLLFAPAQDGAGASTAALHTAGALANDFQAPTLLVEVDYFSDSVAYRLRLAKSRSLSDLVPGQPWREAVTRWRGLHLLAAPTSARLLRARGLPELALAINEACHEYDFVIGDLPCNTAVVSPEILSGADRIFVVATAEVTSLYLARRRIQSLVAAGARTDAVRLIVNRDRRGAVDDDMARQVTGLQPIHRLPNDFAAASEAETDATLVNRDSSLGRSYTALAKGIRDRSTPVPAAPPPVRGWGRLLAALR